MGIGFLEALIILAVVLIFGGWKSLPNIAKAAGEFCSVFKKSYKEAESEGAEDVAEITTEADGSK